MLVAWVKIHGVFIQSIVILFSDDPIWCYLLSKLVIIFVYPSALAHVYDYVHVAVYMFS